MTRDEVVWYLKSIGFKRIMPRGNFGNWWSTNFLYVRRISPNVDEKVIMHEDTMDMFILRGDFMGIRYDSLRIEDGHMRRMNHEDNSKRQEVPDV